MPAQIADWSQVKATAIALASIKDAAAEHGVSYKAAKMRASREQWPVGRRVHKLAQQAQQQANTQMMIASKGTVTSVTSTADALANTLAERQKRSKLGLSSWLTESSEHLASLKGEEALSAHQAAVSTASVMSKLYPEQQDADRVALQFFSISINQGEEKPVIDV
jgi:hypothetical protein